MRPSHNAGGGGTLGAVSALRIIAVGLTALLLGALVGGALGVVSPYVYVALLGPILLGVSVGGGTSMVALVSGARLAGAATLAVLLGVTAGLFVGHYLDDRHMTAAYIEDYARAAMVANGVPEEAGFDEAELAFYADGAADALERVVRRDTGQGGALGRWLFRADSGVRLFGPLAESRGLAVGRVGAAIFAGLELALAFAVGALVVGRVRRRRDAVQPP